MFDWPFNPANDAAVTGASYWLSVLGIVLTVLGFGLTFWQILKTRSLAEATRAEAERIKESLKLHNTIQDISRASYALTSAKKYFKNAQWIDGAESYEDFGLFLSASKKMNFVDDSLSGDIETALKYIDRLCRKIDAAPSGVPTNVDYPKLRSVMRSHERLLGRMRDIIAQEAL